MASPRRIGLVGLSKSAAVLWASVAHPPYLLSPHGKTKYEITALFNLSAESAKKAMEVFNFSPETKTYGDAA
jgi:predicted dehydrogenase